ncbi:hypothetical protein B0H10DRAFT_1956677 [Mycena sp. CBHHK59/15]|nr:hypothetical protein B0H10DRAFT_1956677 [Mycena sp. CBHHK59/15]
MTQEIQGYEFNAALQGQIEAAAAFKVPGGLVLRATSREDTASRDENANHVRTADLKKILRPQQEKPASVDDKDSPAPGDTIDPVSDGPGSSDEFELDKEDEDNDEDDEPMDASEDEEAQDCTKQETHKRRSPTGRRRGARQAGGSYFYRGGPVKRKAPAEQVLRLQVQQEVTSFVGIVNTDALSPCSPAVLTQAHGTRIKKANITLPDLP